MTSLRLQGRGAEGWGLLQEEDPRVGLHLGLKVNDLGRKGVMVNVFEKLDT